MGFERATVVAVITDLITSPPFDDSDSPDVSVQRC
jgi:hypothetical protein